MQVRRQLGDAIRQYTAGLVGVGLAGDAERGSKHEARRVVRPVGLERFAHHPDHAEAVGVDQRLLDQTALADAGFTDDLDPRPCALGGGRHGIAQQLQFVLTTDEGRRARCRSLPTLEAIADDEGFLGEPLAFDQERLEWRGVERGGRLLDRRPAGDDLSVVGLRHQPRRKVHCIAHHGVHAAIVGTHRSGEDVSRVDADRQGQLDTGVEQAASGAQHAALPVLHGIGGAGREDQLAAVTGDVGRDQAHAGLCGSLHAGLDQELQLLMEHAGAVFGEHSVGVTEVHEPDRDVTVLGFDGPALGPSPDRGRHESGQVDVADCRAPVGRSGSPGGDRRRRSPSPLGCPTQRGGSRSAVARLITISPASAVDSISVTVVACCPVTTSSRLRPADDEQVERARVDAHRDPKVDSSLAGDDGAACT